MTFNDCFSCVQSACCGNSECGFCNALPISKPYTGNNYVNREITGVVDKYTKVKCMHF